jgi:uncharacterized protein with ParB-like and HNH nuclease domain
MENVLENILELKTINELQEYNFFIPSYQRGYRWSEKEVLELLNDISDFTPRLVSEDTEEKTWYCLQPVVIKEKSDNLFEVIDGQQRLTTIYLILYYLNQGFVEARRDKLFQLDYETRLDSKEFLENLDSDKQNEKNIDFFYVRNAYETISNWFESEERGLRFDIDGFRSKLKFHSKVIWYLSTEDDSIAIFTRINIGKIPLTNSELIKALFLNSSNYKKNDNKLKLRQLEISTEWDIIERSLQNDRFWYFLNENKKETNRIEFIFDLMNEEVDKNDNYSTFRYFSKKFKTKDQKIIEKNWKEVKDYFQRFNEWFCERDLYHKIGYLVCVGDTNIKELYDKSGHKTKQEFRTHLNDTIKTNLKNVKLSELQYSDNKDVRKVLLLYNIITMLNSDKDNSYFPFNLYKDEKWDIEHITSVKDKMPDKNKQDWLNDAKIFIDPLTTDGPDLLVKANSCNVKDEIEFKSIFQDLVAHFNSGLNGEDINDITNLALLDSKTNRGYKNAVFPLKRKIIINRDKEGVFIPICTKNVFLKYFSEYPPKISFWTQEDRENYEKDLVYILKDYININS